MSKVRVLPERSSFPYSLKGLKRYIIGIVVGVSLFAIGMNSDMIAVAGGGGALAGITIFLAFQFLGNKDED